MRVKRALAAAVLIAGAAIVPAQAATATSADGGSTATASQAGAASVTYPYVARFNTAGSCDAVRTMFIVNGRDVIPKAPGGCYVSGNQYVFLYR